MRLKHEVTTSTTVRLPEQPDRADESITIRRFPGGDITNEGFVTLDLQFNSGQDDTYSMHEVTLQMPMAYHREFLAKVRDKISAYLTATEGLSKSV